MVDPFLSPRGSGARHVRQHDWPPWAQGRDSCPGNAALGIPPGFVAKRTGPDATRLNEAIAELNAGDHICLLYESPAEQHAVLVPFIQLGLQRHEQCVLVTDAESSAGILATLAAEGTDVAAARTAGQLLVRAPEDTYLANGTFLPECVLDFWSRATAEAKTSGFAGLRAVGDTHWALAPVPGAERLTEYEGRVDMLIPDQDCISLCMYDLRRFPATILREVIRTHPVVIRGGWVCCNPCYLPTCCEPGADHAAFEVDWFLRQLVTGQAARSASETHERLLSDILDHLPVAAMVVDSNHRVSYCNRAANAAAENGIPAAPGSPLGHALRCLNALSHPQGCGASPGCVGCPVRQAVSAVLETGKAQYQVPARLATRQQNEITQAHLLVSANPLDMDGQRQVLVCVEDISRPTQMEASLQTFLDALPESALLMKPDGMLVAANAVVSRRLGISPNALLQHNIYDLIPAEVRDGRRRQVERALQTGRSTRFVDRRGGRYIDNIVAPVPNGDGSASRLAIIGMDVTEHIQAKAALAESAQKFRQIVENANDIIYILEPEGTFSYASPNLREALGFVPEDLLGRHFGEWVHPEDTAACATLLEQVVATGERAGGLTYRVRHRGGGWRWHMSNVAPLLGSDGRVVAMLGVARDVTEQRVAEQALRRSEGNLLSTLNGLAANIALLDADGRILVVNRAWREFAENNACSADAVSVGCNYLDVCAAAARAGDAEGERFATGIRAVLAGALPHFTSAYTCHSPDERRWFVGRVTPYFSDDRRHVVVAHENITEWRLAEQALRESEEKFRALVNAAPVSIMMLRDGKYIFGNPAAARLLGYADPAELVGLDALATIDPEHHEAIRQRMSVVEAGDHNPPMELRLRRPDGQVVWTISTSVATQVDGKPTAIIVGQDITERKHALETLRSIADYTADWESWLAPDGTCRWVNPAAEALTGYTPDACRAMPNYPAQLLHADDRAAFSARLCADLAQRGSVNDYAGRIQCRDGSTRWFSFSWQAIFDESETYTGLRISGRDITERKHAEQALSDALLRQDAAIRAGNVGLWDWDICTNKVFYSAEWKRQIGYADEEVGDDIEEWRSRIHPDDLPRTTEHIQAHFAGEASGWEVQFRFRHRQGDYRWILAQASLMRDAQGRPVRALGTHVDITNQKRTEQRLRQQSDVLGQIEDLVTVADLDGVITYVNDAVCRVLGRARDDLIGQHVSVYGSEPVEGLSQHDLVGLTREEGRWQGELVNINAQGERIVLDVRTRLVRNERGEPVALCGISSDITARKRAETALKRSMARLERTEKIAHVGSWEWQIATDHVTWSQELYRIFKLPVDGPAPIWAEHARLYEAADFTRLQRVVEEARQTGKPYSLELRALRTDGQVRECLVTGFAERDVDGRIVRLFGSTQDITELNESDRRLRESETFLRSIYDGLAHSVFVVDVLPDGDFEFVDLNPHHARLTGITPEQIRGRNPHEVLPPADAERMLRHYRACVASGRPQTYEEQLLLQGAVTCWETTLHPIRDRYDRVYRIVGTSQDITERKRTVDALRDSETRYRSLVESAGDAIFVADVATGRLLEVNRMAEALTGRTRDELIGMHQTQLHPPGAAERYRELFSDSVRNRGLCHSEVSVVHRDGRHIPVEINSGGRIRVGGRAVHMGVFRDVSERKQAERVQRDLEEQLRQSQKLEAVGQLAAGVAHDFNNLLTAVNGYCELLAPVVGSDPLAEQSLAGIRDAAQQAAGVTRSLLTFASQTPGNVQRVELRGLVQDSMRLLRRLVPAAVTLELDAKGEAPIWLAADSTKLQQVLLNLAINARDAMPDGGTLRVVVAEEPGHLAEFSNAASYPVVEGRVARLMVADTGVGMTDAVVQRVFEPFFTTKPREQGTGLGLAIVHGIVTEHGGRIEINSTPHAGTRITIRLPVVAAADSNDRVEGTDALIPRGSGAVLVAEDNWNVRSLLATTLARQGFEVIEARDGAALLREHGQHRADLRLLVVDVDLPEGTGLDCLARLRAEGVTTPAIVITGGTDRALVDEVDAYSVLLRKPFEMVVFQRVVAERLAEEAGE